MSILKTLERSWRMLDREAYSQIIFTFRQEVKAIARRWPCEEDDLPTIALTRLNVCNAVIAWAQEKIVELNKKEFPHEHISS